jgi:hypothetical protein
VRWQVAALGLLVLTVLAEVAVLRVGIDDLDEGYFAQQAVRVLHGQVPYRDFDSLYTPGLLYLHAAVFGLLGGPYLLGLRAVALVSRAALAGMTFALGRPLARSGWAVAPALFLLIGLDAAPERWEPHPGWLSTALALLSVWLFPRHLVGAGVAAGLTFAVKQNTGLFMLAAGMLFVWLGRSANPAWRRHVALLVGGFAVITVVWLAPLLLALDGQIGRLAPFVGGVNQAALFSPPEWMDLLPVAAGALGAWWWWRRCPHPLLGWYVVAGAALFLTEYPRMDSLHLVWSGPLLLVIGAIAVDNLRPQTRVLALATLMLASLPLLDWRTEWRDHQLVTITDLPYADGLLVPMPTQADLVGVVDDIRARTALDEPIFVYPSSPLLYVLAQRPNPTRYDHLYPGAAPPREVQAVIAELANVRLVVTSDFWPAFFGPPGDNIPLEAYLAANYHQVAQFGSYHVLAR